MNTQRNSSAFRNRTKTAQKTPCGHLVGVTLFAMWVCKVKYSYSSWDVCMHCVLVKARAPYSSLALIRGHIHPHTRTPLNQSKLISKTHHTSTFYQKRLVQESVWAPCSSLALKVMLWCFRYPWCIYKLAVHRLQVCRIFPKSNEHTKKLLCIP